MKVVIRLLSGLMLLGGIESVVFAQDITEVQSQIEQQKQELQKLKADVDSVERELEEVQDMIKDSQYKTTTLDEKISDLCAELAKEGQGKASNPACTGQ